MQVLYVMVPTVYAWFNRWETGDLAGLANAPGQGRPPVPTDDDEQPRRAAVRENRQQLKEVTVSLRQELNKNFSTTTLKRFLKNLVERGDGFAPA